jgi:phage tail sheath protein FI
MPQYLSPGVYVEEVPSAVKAIAGVSTSIPGFIGIVPDEVNSPFVDVVIDEPVGKGDGTKKVFNLSRYPVVTDAGTFKIKVKGNPTEATLSNDKTNKVSQVTFTAAPANGDAITADYKPFFLPIEAGIVKLCTNFSQFKQFFGDFSQDTKHNYLVHAVYGFFNNGGSSCYVVRIKDAATEIDKALDLLQK